MIDNLEDNDAVTAAFNEWLRPGGIEVSFSAPDEQGRLTATIEEFGFSEQGNDPDEAVERVVGVLMRYALSFLNAGKPLPPRGIVPDAAKGGGADE